MYSNMTERNENIPLLLREELGEDYGLENVLGYKYSSGYCEEDDTSWDFPLRDFIEDPCLKVYFADEQKDRLLTIKKTDVQSNSDTAFEDLHQWLAEILGKDNTVKTDGVFGIIKEDRKYQIEFGLSTIFDPIPTFNVKSFKADVEKLIPEGFVIDNPDHIWTLRWIQKDSSHHATINIDIIRRYVNNHYHTNHADIWYEYEESFPISHEQAEELDVVCRNIAIMLMEKYKDCKDQYIRIKALYLDIEKKEYLDPVEFDFPLNKNETESLKRYFFSDEHFSMVSLECLDRDLYNRIKKKAETMLSVIDDQPRLHVHIDLYWAEGERERLILGCRCLTKEEIDKKQSFIDSLGNRLPSRQELISDIGSRFIWKESWFRESGETWENYTLLKRIPSNEEWYSADYGHSVVRLWDLPTDIIIKLFKDKKLRPLRIDGCVKNIK